MPQSAEAAAEVAGVLAGFGWVPELAAVGGGRPAAAGGGVGGEAVFVGEPPVYAFFIAAVDAPLTGEQFSEVFLEVPQVSALIEY